MEAFKRQIVSLIIALGLAFPAARAFAASGSPDLADVKLNDMIEVRLRDVRPTQPSVGFDRVFYKLGRYANDRKKVFDDYCENNGQDSVLSFSADSNLKDPASFVCKEPVGTFRSNLKTVVIGPDSRLYLTDGHHTFNAFWHVAGGGPDARVQVVVTRDYRDFASMHDFWEQMKVEQNVWLLDVHDQPIAPADLPTSLGLEHFSNDQYRSLMYFTRRIAWNTPGLMTLPDDPTETYPNMPFLEFYWAREIRKTVNLADFNLAARTGYMEAIRAVGAAIMALRSNDVGGSGRSCEEMGQIKFFNDRELARIDRPGTGKIAYMLGFKHVAPPTMAGLRRPVSNVMRAPRNNPDRDL